MPERKSHLKCYYETEAGTIRVRIRVNGVHYQKTFKTYRDAMEFHNNHLTRR